MKMSLTRDELFQYVSKQLDVFFPDGRTYSDELEHNIDETLQRTEYCFSHINNKYFCDHDGAVFNHLHGDQYAMFLYFAANTVYRNNSNLILATKLFQLNRLLHSLDAFYEVELPDVFLVVHPLGTVLGRGNYSNFFLVYQRCSIGSNRDIYPSLGPYLSMHPGASILGNCKVGENCRLATGALLMDKNLEPNSTYIGNPKGHEIRAMKEKSAIWK